MTINKLSDMWNKSGILDGDIVLLHSSIKRTLVENNASPQIILESFLKAVGKEGTLLLPLFNFDFCNGKAFDISNTTSQMGALTEVARQYPSAVRTGHPVYSFAVIGKRANEFKDVCNISAYGSDSPFAMLHKMVGKIAILDLPDQNSMTFYHYVEEMMLVSYRYYKSFTGQYTDWNGISSVRDFTLYVRDVEKGVETYVTPMQEILWSEGLYKGEKPKENSGLRTILTSTLYNRVKQVIEEGQAEGTLYKTNMRE